MKAFTEGNEGSEEKMISGYMTRDFGAPSLVVDDGFNQRNPANTVGSRRAAECSGGMVAGPVKPDKVESDSGTLGGEPTLKTDGCSGRASGADMAQASPSNLFGICDLRLPICD